MESELMYVCRYHTHGKQQKSLDNITKYTGGKFDQTILTTTNLLKRCKIS